MSRHLVWLSIAFVSPLAVQMNAQPVGLGGPIAGFVYDRSMHSVRPLLGMAGSAYLGPALLAEVDSASISPDGRWALVTEHGQSRFVRGLSDLAVSESSTEGLIDAVDRVAWSRDGSFALLYSSPAGQLQRIRLSVGEVCADAPVTVSLGGQVSALAIDPAGRQIAIAVAGSGLYLMSLGQSPALLSSMAQPTAVAFDERGQRLYAVDVDTQRILEFDSGSAALEFASLADTHGPRLDPAGLAVSQGGQYLMLADRTTPAVRIYETASRSLVKTIPLDFAPSRFEPVSAEPAFVLNGDRASDWLLILNAGKNPGVYFVPASRTEL